MSSPSPVPLVLVMCTGNVCRSPMAEAALASRLASAGLVVQVVSRGLNAPVGRRPDPLAIAVAEAHGFPINPEKKAAAVSSVEMKLASMVFVMDSGHRHEVQKRFASSTGKTFLLGHWNKEEILDPINLPRDAFESAWAGIDRGSKAWIERLVKTGMLNQVSSI